jgi:hypothetical protein
MYNTINEIVGKTINKIFISQDYLKFETDLGDVCYLVTGDCCSSSYFQDFYGVKNLLGKKVKEVKSVELIPGDTLASNDEDCIQVYGYQIFFEGGYGDMTAVFSFRNSSNGYYGGSIEKVDSIPSSEKMQELTEDIYQVK